MNKIEWKCAMSLYGAGDPPTTLELVEYKQTVEKEREREESEHKHQVRLHQWLKKKGVLHFAPANEGKRTEEEQRRLSAVGFSCGILDMWVMVPSNGYHGLMMELKAEKGVVSGAQRWWIEQLTKNGYKAVVSWSYSESVAIVEKYMAKE